MRALTYIRRTTLLCYVFGAFLLGLVLARRVEVGMYVSVLMSVTALIFLFWRRMVELLILLSIVIGLVIGLWRGLNYLARLDMYQQLQNQVVTVEGTVSTDAVYSNKGQLSFDIDSIYLHSPNDQKLVGKIAVNGYGEAMVYRGDRVKVTAKLYATRGSRQAKLSFAQIQRTAKDASYINQLRRKFAAGLQSTLPEPLGSFALGILIGQRTTLPDSLNEQLSIVGLTHIVAVSGYNLTIIVLAVHSLLRKRSKYQATIMTLAFIGLFVLLTGSSASIVRAAIVSILSLTAWYYGRTFRPLVLILFAAIITAGWFPPYVWSDIGWYLSFFAFAGVLIVAPIISQRYWGTTHPKLIAQVLIETTSAQLLTLPIIMFVFGRLSVISIVANVLVVPLIPLAMALSFVAGICGMLVPSIAGWFVFPATILLTYMLDVVAVLSKFPYASIDQYITVMQLIIIYLVIAIVILVMWQKIPKNVKIKKLHYKQTL